MPLCHFLPLPLIIELAGLNCKAESVMPFLQGCQVSANSLQLIIQSLPYYAMMKHYDSECDVDTFKSWLQDSIRTWLSARVPTIVHIIKTVSDPKSSVDIIALVCHVRLHTLPTALASIESSDLSLSHLISHIPQLQWDEEVATLQYTTVRSGTIPIRGVTAVGPCVEVDIGGRTYKAFLDFRSNATVPDYIVFGEYPGLYHVRVESLTYVTYQHAQHADSKTQTIHFRLSCFEGVDRIDGCSTGLPSCYSAPFRYLIGRGMCVLDGLVFPSLLIPICPKAQMLSALLEYVLELRILVDDVRCVRDVIRAGSTVRTYIMTEYKVSECARQKLLQMDRASRDSYLQALSM